MKKPIKLNTKFGRWTVLERVPGLNKSNQTRYFCKCSCGTIKKVIGSKLRRGDSLSCGCFAREASRNRMIQHGMSKHRLFPIWISMMQRCYNKNSHAFAQYGSRGISVCARWHNPILFIKDNETKALAKLTLDRIDNDGEYSPKNTYWSTRRQQALNRRSNVLIEFDNKTKPIFQWAYDFGLPPKTLWARINRGWSIERAITTPLIHNKAT